jgi:transposase
VRVSTAFNRILGLDGAWVESVRFTDEGVVVGIRARSRRHRCPCGRPCASRYDLSRRRWRHLDMGAAKVWLEADIARVSCRACRRVRTEAVPWARPGARHSSDFEDVVAWLAQRMDKSAVSKLMRCSWAAVHHIVGLVVAEHLDSGRLDGLAHIGVDEISYKKGHHYLTVVADHDQGRVVWAEPGKHTRALSSFFEALGPARRAAIRAVSMDLGASYQSVTAAAVPQAAICFDPFHVIQIANRALDSVYSSTARLGAPVGAKQWRTARYALRAGAERLSEAKADLLAQLQRSSRRLWRAWFLKERLRDFYRIVEPAEARQYLRRWLRSASACRIREFVALARALRSRFEHIVAAVEWGLSNSRLEGINAKIRVIQRRGYGHRSAKSLAEMIYLCLGGIAIQLPTQR